MDARRTRDLIEFLARKIKLGQNFEFQIEKKHEFFNQLKSEFIYDLKRDPMHKGFNELYISRFGREFNLDQYLWYYFHICHINSGYDIRFISPNPWEIEEPIKVLLRKKQQN